MIEIAVAADDTTESSRLSKTQIVDVRLPSLSFQNTTKLTDLSIIANYEDLDGPERNARGLFFVDNL